MFQFIGKMTKFTRLVAIFALIVTGCSHNKTSKYPEEKRITDTLEVQALIKRAEPLKGSKPDSAALIFNKAIAFLHQIPSDMRVIHLEGVCRIGLASMNCDLGKYPESLRQTDTILSIAKKHDDIDLRARAINIRGLLYFNQSQYDSAIVCYDQALKMAQQIHNLPLQGRIFTNRAIICYLRGDCDNAQSNFEHTLNIALECKDKELEIGTYINMGLTAANFGKAEQAIVYYEKAAIGYLEIKGYNGLVLCHQNIGTIYLEESKFDRALASMNKSLYYAQLINDQSNIAKAHHNIGEIYARVGNFTQSMEEYLTAIRIKQPLKDESSLADTYNGIGNLFYHQSEIRKALDYFSKSKEINERLNLPRPLASTYSFIANCYESLNDYKIAAEYFEKALDLNTRVKNPSGIADANSHLGSLYALSHQFEKSKICFEKALRLKKELKEREGEGMVYQEMANAQLHEAKTAKSPQMHLRLAIEYAAKCYEIGRQIGSIQLANIASLTLKKGYKEIGNPVEALHYSEIFSQTNDSIFTKDKARSLLFAEARWNVENEQKEIDLLKKQKDLQQEIIQQQKLETSQYRVIFIFGAIILGLILLFILFLIYYNRHKREALYQRQISELSSIKMQNIRNRMSPHFILNTLASIHASLHDPERAENKVRNLALLLRKIIENIENTIIALDEELNIVRSYVELQKDKIPGPFHFIIDCPETIDQNKEMIPPMLIQIPVENAIKHGLMRKEEGPNELIIKITDSESDLIIEVIDNGVGIDRARGISNGTGTGLKMISQTIHYHNQRNKSHITYNLKNRNAVDSGNLGSIFELRIPKKYTYPN